MKGTEPSYELKAPNQEGRNAKKPVEKTGTLYRGNKMAYDNFKPQLWADNIFENLDNLCKRNDVQ